jgi:anti-sigma factor RsiW
MSCTKMNERILPYLDGRLKNGERRRVEEHLAVCVACRLHVQEFRAVTSLLGELPEIEPSLTFDARVRARVAAEPVKRGWLAWLTPSPRAAFAASMLLVATVWIASRPPDIPVVDEGLNSPDAEIQMMKDLPVLEDYDVISNFEPLSELPQTVETETPNQQM